MSKISTPLFGDLIGSWHRWFAWKPVKTFDQRRVWLRFVWRRGVHLHQYLFNPHGTAADFWWWYSLDDPDAN